MQSVVCFHKVLSLRTTISNIITLSYFYLLYRKTFNLSVLGQRNVTKGINKVIAETTETCYNFMLKDKEKEMVLNPSGRPPILQIGRSKMYKEIYDLMRQYVTELLRGADMLKKFKGIKGEIFFLP